MFLWTWLNAEEDVSLWHIEYDDGDEEDMDNTELADARRLFSEQEKVKGE